MLAEAFTVEVLTQAEGLVCLAIRSSDDIKQPGINILGGRTNPIHIMLRFDMYVSTCGSTEFSNLAMSMLFGCAGMAMKERMILINKVTDKFGWLEDEKCDRNRLAKLRVL